MTTQSDRRIAEEAEDIEGLDDEKSASWGDYPIDALLIRHESRTIYEVLRRIDKGRYIMNPDFQRDFIWPPDKQSKLIESVIMRIPLPVFYLAENPQGKMIVVDGLQRLSTFHRFRTNQLNLKLPDRPELDGKIFDDLPLKLQNRFEDCNLVLYIIDSKVPERARLDIFERVNGGVPLSRQQMRNCLYMGKATRFLKEESKKDIFLKATGNSLRTYYMRDREFINRFCSFQILNIEDYRNMDDFLAQGLTTMNRDIISLTTLSRQLEYTLLNNFELFAKHAFRKHERNQPYRNVLNASLWDVMSTGLSHYHPQDIKDRSDEIKDGFYRLMADHLFIDSITRGPNTPKQVRTRFRLTREMLEGVFGVYQN